MRTPDELTEAFRRQGLKITPQRQAVFRALYGNEAHPSAESVYLAVRAQMPSISLRTVYQTLNDLAEMGELRSLDLGTGAARFDPNTAEHHHLVCDVCGTVRDVYVGAVAVAPPREQLAGFAVDATEITFRGRCRTCAAPAPATSALPAAPPPPSPPRPHRGDRHA